MEIQVRNPHQGLPDAMSLILSKGISRETRYGPVIVFEEPTTVVYQKPMERVIFWKERDTNPFFNLFEAFWMLSGRNDVAFVAQFVKRMEEFSDDGKTFHAAYGFRWRKHFDVDQLGAIIENLKKNNDCRRQYLGIWDPRKDLGRVGKDLPCNLGVTFQVNGKGQLDMVVHNRSNDLIFGTFAANISHFSILQEYMAAGIGVPVGRYWQVSSNLHAYTKDLKQFHALADCASDLYRTIAKCPYESGEVETTQIVDTPIKEWDEDLAMWMKDPFKVGIRSKFFLRVATPMYAAHLAHRKKNYEEALRIIESQMPDKSDWKKACNEWLLRRKEKHDAKAA